MLAACPRLIGAGHQPRAARAGRRVRLPAGAARRCPAPDTDDPAPGVPSVAVFLDRAAPGPPRLPPDAGGAAPGRRHRPPPRRHAAGDRARRRPAVQLLPRRPAPPARPLARPARRAGPAATPGTGRCAPPSSGPTSCSTDDERRLFRHLAVFVDGVDLDDRRAARRRPGPGRRPRQRAGPAGRRLDDRRRVRRGRHPVPDAGDAAGVRPRPARRGGRGRRRRGDRLLALGGRPRRVDRRDARSPSASPRRTRCCAGSWRTCGRRGGWPAAAGRVDDGGRDGRRAVRRDRLPRPGRDPRLGRGAGRRPGAAPAHPRAAAVLGIAAEAAYHRGDYATGRAARPRGAGAATDDAGVVVLPACRCRWPPWPAGRTPRPSSTRSPRPTGRPGRARTWASPRSPTAYAGELDRARELQRRGAARTRCRRRCARGPTTWPARSRALAGHARSWPSGTTGGPSTWPARRARPSWSASPPSGCSRCGSPPAGSARR